MKKKFSRVLSTVLAVCLTAAIAIPALADGNSTLSELFRGVTVYVDGAKVEPKNAAGEPAEPFIVDNSTYLPARAISDALGAEISWDEATYNVYIDTLKADPKAAEYLTEYFEIEAMTGTVSAETYTAALTSIFGEDAVAMTGTTLVDAVKATVENCGSKAVAAAYTAELATASTNGVKGVSEADAAAVAAALDAAVASGTWDYAAELDGETATQLLMNAVNFAGMGRNYLGNISDTDISAKLTAAFGAFYDFHDLNNESIANLWKLGETIVDRKATTGFGLCSSDYDAKFLNKYTVQYSHSDIDHAVQLVTIMKSLGIDAKVALEPKVSIYLWDGHLNAGMEYNLRFEFNSVEDKDAFHAQTVNYVSRTIENNPVTPIKGAWITPCYNSYVEVEDFVHIYDNVITCGKYSLHPFSLPDNVESVTTVVNEVAAEFNANAAEGADQIVTEVKDLWCNAAFFRYLGGENQ